MTKLAFVTGITGQDGAYLAEFLLGLGCGFIAVFIYYLISSETLLVNGRHDESEVWRFIC